MTKPAETIRDILALVFWAGQHNQYPEQNKEPRMSVDKALTTINDIFEECLPEKLQHQDFSEFVKELDRINELKLSDTTRYSRVHATIAKREFAMGFNQAIAEIKRNFKRRLRK